MAERKINLEALPSNNEAFPNRKKLEPVVSGSVQKRKGSVSSILRDISNALFATTVRPKMEDGIIEFVSRGVEMLVKGVDATPSRLGRHTSYEKIQRGPVRVGSWNRTPGPSRKIVRTRKIFENFTFEFKDDAELVLASMLELIAAYGRATIGDLHGLIHLSSDITHEQWGWYDLSQCRVHYSQGGYVIDFPNPVSIDV